MLKTMKCKWCGTEQKVSSDGWLVDGYPKDHKGKVHHEVKYTPWTHVVGHWDANRNPCRGSGAEVLELVQDNKNGK